MADDKKTLELRIQIAAQEAIKAVDSLKNEMRSLADEAKRVSGEGGEALKKTFKETEAAAKDAAGGIGDIKKALGSLAEVAALTKALGVIKDIGAFALSTADSFQAARNQFGTLLGDMEAGAGLFNEIKTFNDKTPFNLDTLTQATSVLIAAKVPLSELQTELRKFGDLSQGNSQKLTSYVNAFSHAAAKGKVDMQVLNTYINQGVPVLDALARQFGLASNEIYKVTEMVSEGKVSFQDFAAAINDLTAEGGQYFGGMELSSQSLAAMQEGLRESASSLAASFGEMLLPAATAVVKALTAITDAINKSPILKGMLAGALVALTGYLAAMAVKAAMAFAAQMSLNFAIGAINPVVLAATLAVAGLAAGYTMYAADLQNNKRELEDIALAHKKQADSVNDAADAVSRFNQVLNNMTADQIRVNIAEKYKAIDDAVSYFTDPEDMVSFFQARIQAATEALREHRKTFIDSMLAGTDAAKIKKIGEQLFAAVKFLADPGVSDTERSQLQEIIKALTADLEKLTQKADSLTKTKTWQEWFGKITNIDPARIGDSGAKAAELYLDGFEKTFAASSDIAKILGQKIDVAEALRGQQQNLQRALTELFSIDPSQINKPFKWDDNAIKPLVDKLEANAAALRGMEFDKMLFDLNKKIADIGKTESELARETMMANGWLEEQADAVKRLMDECSRKEILASLDKEVENLGKDQYDLALASLKAAGATEEEIKKAEDLVETLRRPYESFDKMLADLNKKIADIGKTESELARETMVANGYLEEQADAVKRLMDECSRKEILFNLGKEVENLGKDQYELALASLKAAGATEEEIKKAEDLVETLRRASESFEEFLARKIGDGLLTIFPEMGRQAAGAIANIATSLAMVSFDGLLNGLKEVGAAFAQGGDAAENFKQAMTSMLRQMLDMLPTLFLQAGLQLIASGQWALGLGFIAASASSAIISGYVDGATKNAKGGVYDEYGSAARAFAAGGTFSNQIVSQPTYFRYGGGLGLMGEAGPEAIMPLKRMADGNLGVETGGGGTNVVINIINNTGAEVSREETVDDSGNRQIDVIIGQLVDSHIASGKADRVMGARYNLRAAGV